MNVKKSFVLYCDYREHIRLLNDAERGQLFAALFDYIIDGKENDLSPMAKMAFSFIKTQLDRDSEKYAQKVNKRKEAGKKGGIAKAQNAAKLANASFATNSLANLADNGTVNENDTVTDNVNENTLFPAPRGKESAEKTLLKNSFERFWTVYPRKTAKQQALKAWLKLKPSEELVKTMLSALEKQKQSDQWKKDNGQFVPFPATWLNGRRWEDDLTCSSTGANLSESAARSWSDYTPEELEEQVAHFYDIE